MIIWSGWGFLGFLVPIVVTFLTTMLVETMYGKGYAALHNWPIGLGLLLSAGAVFLISQRLNTPGRTLVDPNTGQAIVLRRRHTLFFIPLQWIAAVIAVAGLYFLVAPKRSAEVAPSTSTTLILLAGR